MPAPDAILDGLTGIANDWRRLAVFWHVLVAAALVCLPAGWRPSRRAAAILLSAPLLSVSALAWTAGNPFNGAVFAALFAGLVWIAMRLPRGQVRIALPASVASGLLLVGFEWGYPHFLRTTDWTSYTYAAPLGLLPCPTLSAVIGLSLIVSLLDSRRWAAMLSSAGVLYGLIGVV